MIRAEVRWLQVEALTGYQKLIGELQVRGVLREMLNDPEPYIRMRSLSTEPLQPGAPKLSGVPSGTVNKLFIGAVASLGEEPLPPDEQIEKNRQFTLVQGTSFTVRGYAEFPPAADPALHGDMLLKARFFNLVEATVQAVGTDAPGWQRPSVWVNRDQVVGLYLG